MTDSQLNDRFNALSGKLDRVLTRQQEQTPKFNDILARLAHLERAAGTSKAHLKLGKRPQRIDPRTLQMAKYSAALPPPPSIADWSSGISSWGMMLNDQLGDCTIAGCGHAVQGLTASAGNEKTLPEWVVLDYYETWDGYVPGDPSTDQGGVEIDVLNNWRKWGFGYRTHKQGTDRLLAYVGINPLNQVHVQQGIQNFGGSYIGIALPITAQTQQVWDVVGDGQTGNSAPGSWGGHCVWVVGYTPTLVKFVTWGGLMSMTWEFWNAYVDEAYGLLSPDFIKANGLSASGFDLQSLLADLSLVTN